ncbi:N-acetyltransferase [Halobacteriales archaeon QS_9_67_17]|nr:MAG: N-acetyltransferase [Halobacteriales archaeon QS_9_67_17]
MEGGNVRKAGADDVSAIRRVARNAWHAAYDHILGADRVDEIVDSWYDPERLLADDIEPDERPMLVATVDGVTVGFAEAAPDESDGGLAHLYRIYVDPDHWQQGIGSSLLDRIEVILRERGFDRLQLSVLAENDVGISFYESCGFHRNGESENDQLGVREYQYLKQLS